MSDLGDLLEIVFGTGTDHAVDQLLGRAPAQGTDDARPQVVLAVVEAVVDGALDRDAKRHPARDDGHLLDRVCAGHQQPQQRVP